MSSENEGKLKLLQKLLSSQGIVTQKWLDLNGIYQQLTQKYVESGWVERIGNGAFVRKGEPTNWESALHAIQTQLAIPVHLGARTAIEIKGGGHYIRMNSKFKHFLFGPQSCSNLPAWFKKQKWEREFVVIKTNLFPKHEDTGLTEVTLNNYKLTVSSKERAAFEMLHLIPKHQSWEEARLVFEGLISLRPKYVQTLLESCTSIKVKRLFLFLAESTNHSWMSKIDTEKIDLGSGDRVLFKGGKLDKKYRITLPPEFFKQGDRLG